MSAVGTAGIVLCGGQSSRMGRPKAWLPWRGRPVLVHVVEVLRRAVDEVLVVSSGSLELPPLDAPVVADREPGLGPLAGIREGLAHVRAELAYVTATDAPFLEPAFVEALLAYGCAAAPEQGGHVQTLAAVYPRAALACAEALIRAGRMRPLYLLEAAKYRRIPADALPAARGVRGFNTPAEYLDAVREVEPGATAKLELRGRARRAFGRSELEVPVGSLADVLAQVGSGLELVEEGRVAPSFRVSLEGRQLLRETSVPIGPAERVVVEDAPG